VSPGVRQLVVTADDFGAAAPVNEAVEAAHAEGVLTAASLMVAGPAFADAVARARRLPRLGVGLHLVLVEGHPVSDPAAVPDLVDRRGAFRTDMAALGAEIFFRPAVRRQVMAEVLAQFEAFAETGLKLDHVNAHKHFHLHPTVLGAMLRVGRAFGVAAVRAPVEPRRVVRAAEPEAYAASALLVGGCAALTRRRVRAAGLRAPDQVFGLRWSGAMTARRLAALMRRLPPGLTEIYLHPASRDSYEGSAPGYRYVEEFEALRDGEVIAAARGSGAALGAFAAFT
jgi:hopanoid biosynthesis associated protein HpnK